MIATFTQIRCLTLIKYYLKTCPPHNLFMVFYVSRSQVSKHASETCVVVSIRPSAICAALLLYNVRNNNNNNEINNNNDNDNDNDNDNNNGNDYGNGNGNGIGNGNGNANSNDNGNSRSLIVIRITLSITVTIAITITITITIIKDINARTMLFLNPEGCTCASGQNKKQ